MLLTAMMDPTWRYSFACGLEQAVWRGGACGALSPHFHKETQITIVIAGIRRFATRFGLIQVSGDQTAILPAGMPHQALGLAAGGGESVNIYVPVTRTSILTHGIPMVMSTPPSVQRRADRPNAMINEECIDVICEQAADKALQHEGLTASDRDLIAAVLGTKAAIGALARAFSMSREGLTRRFTRATGMTPHAYRLAARLNNARELLCAGFTPATAAVDAGFADQSHLGRHFRAAFGTTPAGYRTAMRA